jgi:hypothetical protein
MGELSTGLPSMTRTLVEQAGLPFTPPPGTPVYPSSSTTAVPVLDTVVRSVGPAVPRRLFQLDGARSPHARDRLGGKLRRNQPYHTPVTSTHLGLLCLPTLPPLLSVMVLSCPSPQ